MKRRTITITFAIVALVATGAIAAAVMPQDQSTSDEVPAATDTTPKATPIAPVNIRTETITTATLTEYVSVNGTTAARTDVTYSAEMPGRIEYLGPALGQPVRPGQLLAKIDFQTLKAQQRQARATRDLARTTHSRLNELGADLVSRQKLDEANTALIGAAAGLDIANSALAKSVVRSTIRGVVSEKFVDKAEYVAPGAPLFRVVDYSTLIIEAKLPETQVSMIEKKNPVSVTFDALGESRQGQVETILPAADPTSRTFTARIKVDNRDLKVLVGMSATVKIAARVHRDVVVIDQDMVVESASGRSVFVVENGIAQERSVRLGAVEGDRVVILEGVVPGETLITMGHRELIDTQPVRIVN